MLKKYRVRDYDFKLIILLIAVTVIGILAIGSAKADNQNKQILGFVMGFFIMIVLSFFDYSFFLRFHISEERRVGKECIRPWWCGGGGGGD